MDAAEKVGFYTVDDIFALPEGERAELIDGKIYMMSSPGRIHQKLVHQLAWIIENYIRKNNGGCEVYPAPFGVFLNKDDRNYFEPDITVICEKDKLSERGCEGAPDWVIEVVSPSSRSMDYIRKLYKYESAGIREYWIADKEKNRIFVYNFIQNDMFCYTFSDKIKVGIYEDLEIDFSEIDLE